MQASFSASGTPREVIKAITEQAKRASTEQPGARIAIVSVRDHINQAVALHPDDRSVEVSASIDVKITVEPSADDDGDQRSEDQDKAAEAAFVEAKLPTKNRRK